MRRPEVKDHIVGSAILRIWMLLLALAHCTPAFAQTPDAERTQNIRNQLATPKTQMASQADIDTIRADLKNVIDALVLRIGALEKDMADIKSRIRVLEARTAPGATVSTGPAANAAPPVPSQLAPSQLAPGHAAPASGALKMNVSMCTHGCDAEKFADAVKLVAEGGTITVEPGDYSDCIFIKKSMKLVGKIGADGGRAHLRKIACNGKGAIDLQAPDVTVQGLKISGISVPDKNGACIRVAQAATKLLIRDIICLDSENGILGRIADKGGVMTIEDSLFSGNGKAGKAHGIYINGGETAILRNVKILAANDGHLLKTGARSTLVENSIFAALGGKTGAAIDAYGGGRLTVKNSVLQLGPNTQNHNFLSYAGESRRIIAGSAHEINIANNWIIYDDANRCCRWLFNRRSEILGQIDIRNNKFVGGIDPIIDSVDMGQNKEYRDREEAGLVKYDGTVESMPKPGS